MFLKIKHFKVIIQREVILFFKFLGFKRKEGSNKTAEKFLGEIDVEKKTVIVLPNIPWDYRMQRPQQIFSRLGKKNFNVFYISPIIDNDEYISKLSKGVFEVHVKTSKRGNVLREFHLDKENSEEFIKSIKKTIGKYIDKKAVLFTLHPVWRHVTVNISIKTKIYDLMDLYSGFPEAKKDLVNAEEDLIRGSNLVICSSENLLKFAKQRNKNTVLIRNGCDFEYFNSIKKNGKLDSIKGKKIVGYFGAIADWFDVDALEFMAKKNKDKVFLLIGSLNTKNVRKLYKYKNVFFLGEIPHKKLGGYLAYFDVCLIPFLLNDLILNTNPVKFYEYISSGKPIVATNLPELQQYKEICYLVKDSTSFDKDLQKAINEKKGIFFSERIKVGKENSWDRRVYDIMKLLSKINF